MNRGTIAVLVLTKLVCLTGLPAHAEIEGECIEIADVEHPTVRKPGNKNYTLKMWSDDLLKWIGQDVREQSALGRHGEDYFILTFNVRFRNTCDRFVAIRPSVFIFEDGSLMKAGRPLKSGVKRAPELVGPSVFEPYWLFLDAETMERTLCSGWELHWDSPAVLKQRECGVVITADSYSPNSNYRVGLSGYECNLPKQHLGGEWEVTQNDKACKVPQIDTPTDPPNEALKLVTTQGGLQKDAVGQKADRQPEGDKQAHEALTREQRAHVQRGLAALGFDPGPADGLFGPKTRAAIWDWQKAKGLETTGYLMPEEAEALVYAGSEYANRTASPEQVPPSGSGNQVLHIAEIGPKCAEAQDGSSCWREIADKPGCYVFDTDYVPDSTVSWSGGCAGDTADGRGVLRLSSLKDPDKFAELSGEMVQGKVHGDWVIRSASGKVQEGPYADGKRNGHWLERSGDGDFDEGPYVDGKRNGHWLERSAAGSVWEGPYVNGKRHGYWVIRLASGKVHEGRYVDGKEHGHWVSKWPDGSGEEGPYVDGKKHGRWVIHFRDGEVYDCRGRPVKSEERQYKDDQIVPPTIAELVNSC